MSTRFPATGIDDATTLPNPATTDKRNSPSHAGQHANANDAIKAIETKIGTGSSTPATSTLLFGTGAGTSAWQTLTSANLAAVLTDETGTGSAVFATTPTLVTPKIDTINESTPSNGTTIGGVNIKSGALNTNNSVVTANITNAAVTPSKLGTGAATAYVATSEATSSTTYTALATAGPAVTVTIGANGLALVIISANKVFNTGTGQAFMGFAVSGATTQASNDSYSFGVLASSANVPQVDGSGAFLLTGLTAGSNTFTAQYRTTSSNGQFQDRRIAVIPL